MKRQSYQQVKDAQTHTITELLPYHFTLTDKVIICFGRGIGLDDPQRSLPTPTIL